MTVSGACTCTAALAIGADLQLGCPVHDDTARENLRRQRAAEQPSCELCADQGTLVLRARCHLTAPLALALEGEVLVVRCYVPSCSREVARFRLAASQTGSEEAKR